MLAKVASVILNFAVQFIVSLVRAKMRDDELEQLGYTKAQVEASKRNNDRRAAALAVRAALDNDAALSARMRSLFERAPANGN